MKPMNLLSLIKSKEKLPPAIFRLFLSNFETKIKDSEIEDLRSLLKMIYDVNSDLEILDSFYVGYTINQIGKEFDLLRFGEKNIINIELKRENTGDRIREQLIRNKYYLEFLNIEVLNFTYVTEDQRLYCLNNKNELIEVKLAVLISELLEQKVKEIDDIHTLFDPSNYLVSPFNLTEQFIENRYF